MSDGWPMPAARDSRRLFFALWPDESLRSGIVGGTAALVAGAGGRAVPPENLHVTLAFLGAVPMDRVAAALEAAAAVPPTAGVERFDRVTAWGRGGPLVLEPRSPGAALAALRRELHNALVAAGFRLEPREFRPHITLVRKPSRRPGAIAVPPLDWSFEAFVLVESATGPAGSRYAVAAHFAGRG